MSTALVDKIKAMQRSDNVAKEQWYAYCEQYGADVRDPSKHDDQFMLTFVNQYNSGQRWKFQGAAMLARFIKMGQGKSPQWKACWQQYCANSDAPKEHDPTKHDYFFLEGFFDFIGKMAVNGSMSMGVMDTGMLTMGGAMKRGMSGMEPVAKKLRAIGNHPMGNDGAKEQLVMHVKAFQKASVPQKELWHAFCDTHLDGVRDPARVEAESLQYFLSTHDDGSMPSPSPTMGNLMSLRPSMMTPSPKIHASPLSARNQELVQQIKAFQKQGELQKNTWHEYCDTNLGGIRDPARADAETLQQFLLMYAGHVHSM